MVLAKIIIHPMGETGQVVAADFKEGNVAPSMDNLTFIHQCEAALPSGMGLSALRIDSADYQVAIINGYIEQKNRTFQKFLPLQGDTSLRSG